jgi:hypothetical protein
VRSIACPSIVGVNAPWHYVERIQAVYFPPFFKGQNYVHDFRFGHGALTAQRDRNALLIIDEFVV